MCIHGFQKEKNTHFAQFVDVVENVMKGTDPLVSLLPEDNEPQESEKLLTEISCQDERASIGGSQEITVVDILSVSNFDRQF